MKSILMDSEYCSMGRWISLIVAAKMNMKLYEGKDLVELADEDWLTVEYLNEFDERISKMSRDDAKASDEIKKVHKALSKAIKKAINNGPCIIHERAASEVIKDNVLKVLLYNTSMEHKIPRAKLDVKFHLENSSHDQIVDVIHKEDRKRSTYHDAISQTKWGQKESYDLCLDSDVLSREKCPEILIESLKNVTLDLDECAQIIKKANLG